MSGIYDAHSIPALEAAQTALHTAQAGRKVEDARFLPSLPTHSPRTALTKRPPPPNRPLMASVVFVCVADFTLSKSLTSTRRLREDGSESLSAIIVVLLYRADLKTGLISFRLPTGQPITSETSPNRNCISAVQSLLCWLSTTE